MSWPVVFFHLISMKSWKTEKFLDARANSEFSEGGCSSWSPRLGSLNFSFIKHEVFAKRIICEVPILNVMRKFDIFGGPETNS